MLVNNRREGAMKEFNNDSAAQDAAAAQVLNTRQTMGFARPEEMERLNDLHDTQMAHLVALHGGSQALAEATLAGVGWAQRAGKR